ncbi:diaminopimelate decarboxylase [Candidatus Bathyarchaeota archaeon]|nr:MAG: diaminopimelate decarboxylase [Candidatus Bathyarchaeota archaeon]
MPLKFSLNPYLEDRDGVLYIDGVSSLELVDKFDTPLYVLAERRIRENYRRLYEALRRRYEKVRIYYSAKANTGLSVLKILESEGSYLDAVSPGEVFLALKAGFTSDRILFTGTSVRNDELRYLVDSGVTINIDSLSQLRRLLKIHVPEVLSVRVNPEIGAGHHEHCITAGRNSKFGIWDADVVKAYRYAKNAGVKRFGMQMHIGSGILTIEPFLLAAEKLLNIAYHIREELDVKFDFVDLGGGIGVPYKPGEKPLDIDLYAENLIKLYVERINEYDLGEPWFCIEPGRYIICDAGILLTLVNTVKTTPFKKFVGVDAGFNTLIRPAMYGSYHPIIVANKLRSKDEEVYDIAGPLCESGDLLATGRKLPKISEGDLLAILNAGAYGFSMSSNYNSRPRCGEVLVKDGEYALVRRREHLEDLLRGQEIPSWLR